MASTKTREPKEAAAARIAMEGTALAGFARLLGPDTSAVSSGTSIAAQVELLVDLGAADASQALAALDDAAVSDPEALKIVWTTLFSRGTVPPYETSYMMGNVVGHTGELADIAGFYKAFGFSVHLERPDHLLPELEFTALLMLRTAEALSQGETEGFDVCTGALESFLRDHVGCWIDDFAARLALEEPGNPYIPIVESAAEFVSYVCASRSIDLRKPIHGISPQIPGVELDSDDLPVGCHGCPAIEEDELTLPD